MDQVVQVAGAMLILIAFSAQQLGRMPAGSRTYVVLNLFGSAILAVIAVVEEQWGFVLLEGVWAIVSAWSLWRLARGLPIAGASG
jgi:hypothetical protein